MNKRSYNFIPKGDASMAQQNEPLVQPEELDMPDDEVLYELADLFRVFGDSTRIKILYALHDNELCVQDIANACANCAQKMEDAANTVAGVEKATVSFMTQKMKVEFAEGADPHATMENVLSACKKVEDDCEIFDI